MELIKDEDVRNPDSMHSGFCSMDGDNSLYFSNGKLEATAYSYEIGSVGSVELDRNQTEQIYHAMKKYYDRQYFKEHS